MPKINRITLFKIPEPANVDAAIDKYATLSRDAVKSGSPYIISALASRTHDDSRNQGYTLVARTVFQSKEDMEYYDNECQAHAEIKALLKQVIHGPPLMVYTDLNE